MNSNTRLSTRTAAFATCLIALVAGATACGTEDGTDTAPASSVKQAKLGTSDFSNSSQAGNQASQDRYLQQLQAQHDALQSPKYGDDRRATIQSSHKYGDDRRPPLR